MSTSSWAAPATTTSTTFPLGKRVPRDVWSAWQRLASSAPPYLVPEWFTLTARAFDRDALLLAARRGDELVAALALQRAGRELVALTSEHTPRTDLVGSPSALEDMWRTLRDDRSWDSLVLPDVPRASPLFEHFVPLAEADGFICVARASLRSPYLPLAGFEARLSSSTRNQLRRKKKKLGDVAFERLATFDRAALDEAFAIEALAWKGVAGTAIRDDATLRRFYYALARTFARRGRLSLSFLRVAGRRIAFHLSVEDARTQCLLKLGYDPSLSDHSPGNLLMREVCEDAERRGLSELDMLGRDDEWKLRWSTLVREHVDLFLYRRSPRGRFLHAMRGIRPTAGRLVRAIRRAANVRRDEGREISGDGGDA
jgi:CelD/BcsL family acetyltransferase involved in cellulose biosynthesis